MRSIFYLPIGLTALAMGCNQPQKPRLSIESVDTVHTDSSGLVLKLNTNAHNANGFPLTFTNIKGSMTLEQVPVEGVTLTGKGTLPAHTDKKMVFDVKMPWKNMAAAFGAGDSDGKFISFAVKGTAELELRDDTIKVPFSYQGKLDRMKLVSDALKFIPIPKTRIKGGSCGAASPTPLPKRKVLHGLPPGLRGVKLIAPPKKP